ncbi:hypothetical protein P154DRAFT_525027 [Amniculicola lignicola CBS 123094]|uniref:Uncharacterized protein n=1 Tax=Amniculicola lignicola CBS 123094 TaxID=1392246 RepID=A0A6A5W5S2_9PLEO|nr:hypothetical protein P154DRAFT_525027 [Amniculicola lignicola CBS 123094]
MKLILITLPGLFTISFAWPYAHQQQSFLAADEDPMLERPLHTTALMAGETWRLTEAARSASMTRYPPSAPTKETRPYDEYERVYEEV